MTAQVIKGVEVAPGEVKCGVAFSLMEARRQRFEPDRLAPYFDPDSVIPSCPVLGKPETIDLSDMEI
ncbi:MAG: hypothetical protein ACRDDI_13405 [Aeromonas veronii]